MLQMIHNIALFFASRKCLHYYPFSVDINHVDEIDEIVDAISYMKGASVIQMFCAMFPLSIVKKGLSEIKFNPTIVILERCFDDDEHHKITYYMFAFYSTRGYMFNHQQPQPFLCVVHPHEFARP
ncbi:hypothetical protein ACJX0J_015892 [Zea mays]